MFYEYFANQTYQFSWASPHLASQVRIRSRPNLHILNILHKTRGRGYMESVFTGAA
jgi:hypothetical protein